MTKVGVRGGVGPVSCRATFFTQVFAEVEEVSFDSCKQLTGHAGAEHAVSVQNLFIPVFSKA
jgi:hypothetical protein